MKKYKNLIAGLALAVCSFTALILSAIHSRDYALTHSTFHVGDKVKIVDSDCSGRVTYNNLELSDKTGQLKYTVFYTDSFGNPQEKQFPSFLLQKP